MPPVVTGPTDRTKRISAGDDSGWPMLEASNKIWRDDELSRFRREDDAAHLWMAVAWPLNEVKTGMTVAWHGKDARRRRRDRRSCERWVDMRA
jgi:hypothetical protein